METDLAMNVIALRMALYDRAAAIAVMRTDRQMQEELLRALDPDRSAPLPAGQGRIVDRTA